MNDKKDNWDNIRGKKINVSNKPQDINFSLMNKRIYIIVEQELLNITWKDKLSNLPNKYGSWIVK